MQLVLKRTIQALLSLTAFSLAVPKKWHCCCRTP